jgi:hypothetical protein
MIKIVENKTAKEWFKKWSNKYDKALGKMQRHHDLLNLEVKMMKYWTWAAELVF